MARRKKDAADDLLRSVQTVERASRDVVIAEPPVTAMRLIEEEDTGDRFLLYQSDGGVEVELRVGSDSFWATQAQMAAMFGVDQSGISRHVNNILADGELPEAGNMQKLHIGPGKPTTLYSLNMLISVGYRVGGPQGTLFRIWATDKLFRYLTKGFVVDVRRLKEGGDASRLAEFRGLARDLRSEQRNIHDELNTLCTFCSDYVPSSPDSKRFFQHTSAKIFYAATRKTPSEVIFERANARLDNMGLATWPTYPRSIAKRHVTVAKNYLDVGELEELNRFTTLLLDFMEDQAKQGRLATIAEASAKVDEFTKFTGRIPLSDGGSRSRSQADAKAQAEWDKYQALVRERRREFADAQTPDLIEQAPRKRRPKPTEG